MKVEKGLKKNVVLFPENPDNLAQFLTNLVVFRVQPTNSHVGTFPGVVFSMI